MKKWIIKKTRIHQVIGSKVVKILKSELTFSLIDKIDTKFSTYKTGENWTRWSLSGLNTQATSNNIRYLEWNLEIVHNFNFITYILWCNHTKIRVFQEYWMVEHKVWSCYFTFGWLWYKRDQNVLKMTWFNF